jgi:hypothetical protein
MVQKRSVEVAMALAQPKESLRRRALAIQSRLSR